MNIDLIAEMFLGRRLSRSQSVISILDFISGEGGKRRQKRDDALANILGYEPLHEVGEVFYALPPYKIGERADLHWNHLIATREVVKGRNTGTLYVKIPQVFRIAMREIKKAHLFGTEVVNLTRRELGNEYDAVLTYLHDIQAYVKQEIAIPVMLAKVSLPENFERVPVASPVIGTYNPALTPALL